MKVHITTRTALLGAFLLVIIAPASANLEITDFFSDYTSSEVTIRASQEHHGKAVFQLFDGTRVVESREVPFKASAGEEVSKVILWQNKPQNDYYTAKVSIFNDTKLHDNKTYPVSYGTVAMPGFHVVDFSPSNKGVQLLLRPFNPSAVDTKTRDIIVDLLKRVSGKGQTTIIVTHDIEVARQTDRIITMRDGAIASDTGRDMK